MAILQSPKTWASSKDYETHLHAVGGSPQIRLVLLILFDASSFRKQDHDIEMASGFMLSPVLSMGSLPNINGVLPPWGTSQNIA